MSFAGCNIEKSLYALGMTVMVVFTKLEKLTFGTTMKILLLIGAR
jgi:hypothetical protein